MTTIECYKNEDVTKVRQILDDWAIRAYREYPYFYVYDEETDYNTMFEVDPTAFVLFADQGGKEIAHLSANALDSPLLATNTYAPIDALDEIETKGYDLKKILYISCFLMEDRQNKDVANLLFYQAVEIAKEMGKTHLCYMAHRQEPTLKPEPHVPVEPWHLLESEFENLGVEVQISWPTLLPNGGTEEKSHTLELFILRI
ncbi:MAG: hypothetical protein JSS30_03430 [Verrucomicrobia bacterium]|nr:hypothetical protein [Verrucomicrobiota bacterium]